MVQVWESTAQRQGCQQSGPSRALIGPTLHDVMHAAGLSFTMFRAEPGFRFNIHIAEIHDTYIWSPTTVLVLPVSFLGEMGYAQDAFSRYQSLFVHR